MLYNQFFYQGSLCLDKILIHLCSVFQPSFKRCQKHKWSPLAPILWSDLHCQTSNTYHLFPIEYIVRQLNRFPGSNLVPYLVTHRWPHLRKEIRLHTLPVTGSLTLWIQVNANSITLFPGTTVVGTIKNTHLHSENYIRHCFHFCSEMNYSSWLNVPKSRYDELMN